MVATEGKAILREIMATPEIPATTEDTEATKVEVTLATVEVTATTAMIGVRVAVITAVTTVIMVVIMAAGLWISRSGESLSLLLKALLVSEWKTASVLWISPPFQGQFHSPDVRSGRV
ncbi:MAG: hypothetical protein ACOYMW_16530, partial [Candidatus Competibacteraceae bacterium]